MLKLRGVTFQEQQTFKASVCSLERARDLKEESCMVSTIVGPQSNSASMLTLRLLLSLLLSTFLPSTLVSVISDSEKRPGWDEN